MLSRLATQLFVSLPLGLLVAILVSVGCALWSQPGMGKPMIKKEAGSFWLKYGGLLESNSFAPPRAKGVGYTQFMVGAVPNKHGDSALQMIVEAGWPMACFYGEMWHDFDTGAPVVRRARGVAAPNGIGPLPVDQRRDRMIPFGPLWVGLGANTVLYAILVRISLWWLLARLIPTERGQRVTPSDPEWLAPRIKISLAVGVVLTLITTYVYALAPRASLAGSKLSLGRTELGPGTYLVARREQGTGAVLNALYVPDPVASDGDDSWQDTDLPPADTIPDSWCAMLLDDFNADTDLRQGVYALGFGWPRPVMWLTYKWEGSGIGASDARFYHGHGGRWLGGTEPHVGLPRALPAQPIFSGLMFNAITYSGSMLALLVGLGVARRLVRLRNGQCQNCGYLFDESTKRCPECRRYEQDKDRRLGLHVDEAEDKPQSPAAAA